jgi:hypothetical protein
MAHPKLCAKSTKKKGAGTFPTPFFELATAI